MDVIIQSLGFTAKPQLESFIREKAQKLQLVSDQIIRVDVTLSEGPKGGTGGCWCEARVEIPGNDPFAKKHADNYEQAVDETFDALLEVMRRAKEKNEDRYRRGGSEIPGGGMPS